jgi:hypothetical protein
MAEFIIDDDNYRDFIQGGKATQGNTFGLVYRDPKQYPVGSYGAPEWDLTQLQIIPRSEWSDRIKEMKRTKSRLSDLRNIADKGKPFENLDQNGQSYCWVYSTVHSIMLWRASMGLPYVRLSAHAVGCKVKNYADQGGWAALSMEYVAKHGVPSVEFWKEKSMSRSNDTEATWQNAAKHKITSGWVELSSPVYDRKMTFDQFATCLLNRIPVATDFYWWGHSVCSMDLEEVEPGSFGVRILNSWKNWGENGTAVLRGEKAFPTNAVAPRGITSSAA